MRTFHILTRSLCVSYLLSLLLLACLSVMLYQFHLPVSKASLGVYALYALSCFLGGFLAGKGQKSRRFFWGLLSGLLYFLILVLMTLLIKNKLTTDTSHLLQVLGLCAAGGMAGGMLS